MVSKSYCKAIIESWLCGSDRRRYYKYTGESSIQVFTMLKWLWKAKYVQSQQSNDNSSQVLMRDNEQRPSMSSGGKSQTVAQGKAIISNEHKLIGRKYIRIRYSDNLDD